VKLPILPSSLPLETTSLLSTSMYVPLLEILYKLDHTLGSFLYLS
jgi:hypothetical protein